MDKKIVKALVEKSLTGKKLDNKKVLRIAGELNRTQLKTYIDGLKRWIQKNTVVVETAGKPSLKIKDEFRKIYPDKEVVFRQRPELLLGTRIIDNDMIYEMDLMDTLKHMQQYITAE